MIKDLVESTPPATGEISSGEGIFVMPCSVSQKRFWLLDQISPGNTALLIPLALKLSGPLDLGILQRALDAMVSRHEILRTHFAQVDDEPKQIIAPEGVMKLHRLDLGTVPAAQYAERTRSVMDEEARRSLSLTEAPLLRATLVRLAAEEHVLMLTAHHIIGDGWSNGVLVRELGIFYDAFLLGREPALPPLEIQYADYVLWQEEWLRTPEFQQQLDYWSKALAGELPVLDFPADFTRQIAPPTSALLESRLLPAALTEALKRFCVEEGVTLFMVFYSAYVALLHRYTGQAQIMAGTTAANRNQPNLEALIGLFANIQILRSEVCGEMSFREFLSRQRDLVLGSFAHHEAPFERVLEQLQQRPGGAPKTLLQTHFLYQRAFMQPATGGGLTIQPLHSVSPGSTFELTFGIVERSEGIRLQMEYRTSLFKASTIRRLLAQFEALLEAVVAQPEMPVDDLPIHAGNELEEMEAALQPRSVSSADQGTVFDPAAVLADLDRQLEHHFQKGGGPFTPPVELPPDVVLVALDGRLRLLPAGIPGDIYLGHRSAHLKIIPGCDRVSGPADVAAPLALLKTGFIGRNMEAARVELWGRAEDIVSIASFRFNLRAVEAQLRLHPAVAEAAVVLFPQKASTGYAVLKSGVTANGEELRTFLRGKISDWTLPSSIVLVPSLPRDAEGKLLVERLPAPPVSSEKSDPEHSPMLGVLHQQLIQIWRDILKTPDIGINDNFFDCGGNSFLALRMMIEAGKLCGRPLPLTLLLTGATIVHLARFIIQANAENESTMPLIPLQTKGARPPLFFLHGDWAGGGFYCQGLSRQLGNDQPFYVLPPYQAVLRLEEMAAFHCAVIRKQSPRGPYLLGGYCIGALVAREMARQLTAEGETVSHLFLIDPPLAGGFAWRLLWPCVDGIGRARNLNLDQRVNLFDRTAVSMQRWLKRPLADKLKTLAHRLGVKRPPGPAASATEDDLRLFESFDYSIYFLAYRLHKFRPLSVPATFYFPESTSAARLSRLLRGSRMDPAKYRVEIVPGTHTTCVTKDTSVLVEKMRATIDAL